MNLQINKIDFITLPDASPICTRQKQSFYCKIFIEVINFGENFTSLLQRTFNFVSLQSIGGDHFGAIIQKGVCLDWEVTESNEQAPNIHFVTFSSTRY
jgi:hypothetical protein